jgi:hypothetical protein
MVTKTQPSVATSTSGGTTTETLPLVMIDSPANNALVLGPQITVSGRASCIRETTDINHNTTTEDITNLIQKVEVKFGAGQFQQATPTGLGARPWKTWSFSGPRPAATKGQSQMQIRARVSVGGLTFEDTITVHFDKTPPTLTILTPHDGEVFTLQNGAVTVSVTGQTADSQSSVKQVDWTLLIDGVLGSFTLAQPTGNATNPWATWAAAVPLTAPGKYTLVVRAEDTEGNHISRQVMVDVAELFQAADAKDVVSAASYLKDLLDFADQRIVGPITPEVLANIYCQHFDALFLPENKAVAQQPAPQVRIAIEVLRLYLAQRGQPPQSGIAAAYCQAAYRMLLNRLGASYEEVRLARAADQPTRTALANRLGIGLPELLDRLFLGLNAITEANLERLFGLLDTTRQPFAGAVMPEPEVLTWQRQHLRRLWQEQDRAARDNTTPPQPIIDPDLIGEQDITAGNQAHKLWQERQKFVADQLGLLETRRKEARQAPGATPLSEFDAVVGSVLGPVDNPDEKDDLLALVAQYHQGQDIKPQLEAKQLNLPAFLYLMRVRELAATGTLLEEEWLQVLFILVQVQKRSQYLTWRQEENNLILGPDYFKLADLPAGVVLPAWRATREARRLWQETLRARIDQDQAAGQALHLAVAATEEVCLPQLRQALLATLDPAAPVADLAERLTKELYIDFSSSGSLKTNRLAQALETLQGILFALRTGHLASTQAVLGTNPAAQWQLNRSNGYSETQFDAEWQWLGAYATWRAAMLIFFYPQNLLLPTLREPHPLLQSPTTAFKELVVRLRSKTRLTRQEARAQAALYLQELRAETLTPPLAQELKNTSFSLTEQLTDAELKTRRTLSVQLFGTIASPHTAPNWLQEVFYFTPMLLALELEKSDEYLASLDWLQTIYAYNLPLAERKIYHGLAKEAEIIQELRRTPDWLLDGLNPHVITVTRQNAYTQFTLMTLARCCLAFADELFTRETGESLPQARTLYATVLDLLALEEMQPPQAEDATAPLLPPNPVIQALRFHAALNLFKLRNGLNIAGLERPSAAQAASVTVSLQPTPYRYLVLIERAKQLVAQAQQLESAFLAALEKRDMEAYNLLKAKQDVQLAFATVQLQNLRLQEAQDGVTLAALQQQRAQISEDHFQSLLDEGWSGLEIATVAALGTAAALLTTEAAIQTAKAIGTLGLTEILGDSTIPGSIAAAASANASLLSTIASFERREQEWGLQLSLARQDSLIGEQQVKLAEDHVLITGQELAMAEIQVEHADAILDFLSNKFTNMELHEWMSGILGQVYSFFLQQATAIARLAERQLRFERQEMLPEFIQADYWQAPRDTQTNGDSAGPDRRGLTGSARLLEAITRLDQHAFLTDQRKLQLTKTISLAALAPAEFQRFRETGLLIFATPMELFDRDFPGHYLRLIKRVRTTVIALTPPHQGIRATLSNVGASRVALNNQAGFELVTVNHGPQSVALSAPINASGLFELADVQPEMLLPFESIGVDSVWEFRMPKAANAFDFETIADVLVTIEYTALDSPLYRKQVIETLNPTLSADRPFSFRHQFADQWYDLHNPDQTAQPLVVRFKTGRADFAPNLTELRIQQILLYFAPASDEMPAMPITATLRFSPAGQALSAASPGGQATTFDGVISTRRGNAGDWLDLIGQPPSGEWELALEDTTDVRNLFKNEIITDMLLVITYQGRTPAWPA